jgi:hypothetical protein
MSLAQQFFQLLARGVLAFVGFGSRRPNAAGKFKMFAEVADGFFQNRLGAAFAALLGHTRVVAGAVQADPQIHAAFHARLSATRLAGERPGFAAIMAMSRHRIFHLRFAPDDFNTISARLETSQRI